MKLNKIGILAMSVAVFAVQTIASNKDITVFDNIQRRTYGSDPRSGIHEAGSVTKGSVASNDWDLKAFGYNGNTKQLTLVSGFDLLNGNDNWELGDLFFDIDGNVTRPLRPNGNGYYQYQNPGFDYVIHFTGTSLNQLQYNIYKMTSQSQVISGYFDQVKKSDPYQVIVDGSLTLVSSNNVSPVTFGSNAYVNSFFNTDIGNFGTNHLATFNLSFLNSYQNFDVRTTLECNNDTIVGYSAVPETPFPSAVVFSTLLVWIYKRMRNQ